MTEEQADGPGPTGVIGVVLPPSGLPQCLIQRGIGALQTVNNQTLSAFIWSVADLLRGDHTQTLEGFWSLVKGGVVGPFHKVSAKYLRPYVAEFQVRYNNRENPDILRAATC
jgi:hypothetical protein